MSLRDWEANGWVRAHRILGSEVASQLEAADSDLSAAKTASLPPTWRFNIAYNAALRLCTLALNAEGYRAERADKHYRTIASLRIILGDAVGELVEFLDKCRSMRHDVTYEAVSGISHAEADELIEAVQDLRATLLRWLKKAHPDLI